MESLPSELVEKILSYLTYCDCGKVLTVCKRWNMIVKGLLPPTVVIISRQREGNEGKGNAAVEKYNLYSSYRGNPVYISNCTRKIWTGNIRSMLRMHESWKYLFKMEKVWYEQFEKRLVARHDSWRWYVGANVGGVSINDGFLQSKNDSVSPPENGSSWSSFVMRYFGWCGNARPSHPKIGMIDFIDVEDPREPEDDDYAKKENNSSEKKHPLFTPFR
eukprot:TRINITY_DN17763_c0_g1_i1.p1 TRINITY_DN17763_c0_g1~~TRINITY_DN17763_c0_g1_i1.p1  ORF type:complete len:218 (-),score=24.83 TRINITY_DN17763_c0_g1_i1:101-754(-)